MVLPTGPAGELVDGRQVEIVHGEQGERLVPAIERLFADQPRQLGVPPGQGPVEADM